MHGSSQESEYGRARRAGRAPLNTGHNRETMRAPTNAASYASSFPSLPNIRNAGFLPALISSGSKGIVDQVTLILLRVIFFANQLCSV